MPDLEIVCSAVNTVNTRTDDIGVGLCNIGHIAKVGDKALGKCFESFVNNDK